MPNISPHQSDFNSMLKISSTAAQATQGSHSARSSPSFRRFVDPYHRNWVKNATSLVQIGGNPLESQATSIPLKAQSNPNSLLAYSSALDQSVKRQEH